MMIRAHVYFQSKIYTNYLLSAVRSHVLDVLLLLPFVERVAVCQADPTCGVPPHTECGQRGF